MTATFVALLSWALGLLAAPSLTATIYSVRQFDADALLPLVACFDPPHAKFVAPSPFFRFSSVTAVSLCPFFLAPLSFLGSSDPQQDDRPALR